MTQYEMVETLARKCDVTLAEAKAALEAAFAGIEVLIQEARGLDSFYAERNGLIIGY